MTDEQLTWFKSSYSDGEGGECLEVAYDTDVVHLRDSKQPIGLRVALSSTAWRAFLSGELVSDRR